MKPADSQRVLFDNFLHNYNTSLPGERFHKKDTTKYAGLQKEEPAWFTLTGKF
jgi:hypothetical protein